LSSNALRLEAESQTFALIDGFLYEGRYYFYQGDRDPAFIAVRVGPGVDAQGHSGVHSGKREGVRFPHREEDDKYRWAESADGSDRITH